MIDRRSVFLWIWLIITALLPEARSQAVPVDSTSTVEVRHFPDGFKQNYTSQAFRYAYPGKGSGPWDSLKNWFAERIRDWFDIPSVGKATGWVELMFRILYVLAFALALYFVYKAVDRGEEGWMLGRSNPNLENGMQPVLERVMETDYKDLIGQARQRGDYRLAIRYYYLNVLKNMTRNRIIEWHPDKTNMEYLREIKDPGLRRLFARISYIYEYAWYGEFSIGPELFRRAEKTFETLFERLK